MRGAWRANQRADLRVERHHRRRAAIALQRAAHREAQRADSRPLRLDLDQQRHPPGDQGEHLGQARHRLVGARRRIASSAAAGRSATRPGSPVSRSSVVSRGRRTPRRRGWPARRIRCRGRRAIAAAKAARLFSTTPARRAARDARRAGRQEGDPLRRGPARSARQAGANGDDRIDLDRRAERQHRHADRAARMAPGIAEHRDHQLGGAVGDLGLVGEMAGRRRRTRRASRSARPDRAPPSAALICARIISAAALGRLPAMLDIEILAEPPGDQRAVLAERQLAGDMEQPADLDRRHIGGDGRGGLGKGEAEFGKAGRAASVMRAFRARRRASRLA